ncbi:MAG TPA: alpha/beta fold hydrolase [Gaiellaceae bacterium]|nr:alpha/beta fold hydrolase [Gaiellaceae bacterium]
MRAAATAAVLLLLAAGCGGGRKPLDAKGKALPTLAARCHVHVDATVGWFRASDGVLLDGAVLGSGPTGVVLAHEYPNDLCGWARYAHVLARAGFRVLLFDHRHYGLSESPTDPAQAGRYSRDLAGGVAELKREGAKRVFLMGGSFGAITSIVAGSRLGSKIAGVISVSGEELLGNDNGPNEELDAIDAVPKLRAPFLVLNSRHDTVALVSAARDLERRAGSAHKRLVLFPGGDHGWDLLTAAPYRARASADVIHFLRRYGR